MIEKEAVGARASGKAWAVISFPPSILISSRSADTYFGMSGKESITNWQDLYWAAYFRMSDLADDIQDKVGLDIEYGASPIIYYNYHYNDNYNRVNLYCLVISYFLSRASI
ncbi:MAG: hypothetical protein ACYSSN_11530 [Planctomycetota bacterium]|jgi:hypothetical protein